MKICNTTKFSNSIQVDIFAEDDVFMIEPKFTCTLDAGAEIEFTPKLPEAQPGSSLGSTAEPPADMPSPMISSRNALQQEGQQEQTQQQPAPTPQLPKSYVLVCRSDFSQKKKTEEDDAFDFMNITPVTVQSKSHTCAGVAPESVVRVVANGEDDFNIQTQ